MNHDFSGAIEDFDKALSLDPTSMHALAGRAESLAIVKEYDQALRDTESMRKLAPRDPESWETLGVVHLYRKKIDDAVAAFTRAIEIDPNSTVAHYQLTKIYAANSESKYRDGNKAFDHATLANDATDWKSPEQFEAMAIAYAQLESFDEAVHWQKECLKICPDWPGGEKLLGLFREKQPFRFAAD